MVLHQEYKRRTDSVPYKPYDRMIHSHPDPRTHPTAVPGNKETKATRQVSGLDTYEPEIHAYQHQHVPYNFLHYPGREPDHRRAQDQLQADADLVQVL